jgi:hypothetical protein
MQIDYLWSDSNTLHAINCNADGSALEVGILCCIALREATIRIANEHHAFIVEVPKEFISSTERVKAFNVTLNVISHEQV